VLPNDIWKAWEPRVIFPVFADCENTFDFAVQTTLRPRTLKEWALPGYYALKKQKDWGSALRCYGDVLFDRRIRFRGAFLDRDGQLIKRLSFEGAYGPGDSFSLNLNEKLQDEGVSLQDGEFLLIASRGRADRWSSSPGNVTARYVGERFIAGYRTGFFARPLNENRKAHFGFTGLNPKVLITNDLEASLLLINHSSDPSYDVVCRPTVRLHRSPQEFIEADFGDIPPLGMRERRLTEMFPNAREYLAPVGGRGFTVTKVKGVTLASIHMFRSHSNQTFSLEHSRPSHANVIRYAETKGYMKDKKLQPKDHR
jgi:hypothetical protein